MAGEEKALKAESFFLQWNEALEANRTRLLMTFKSENATFEAG